MKPLRRAIQDESRGSLLITADPYISDAVGRLAGAAAARLTVVACGVDAAHQWSRAPLVLVGDDQVGEVLAIGLARRPGVVLVGATEEPSLWRRAIELGAEHVALLPSAAEWLSERLAEGVEGPARAGVLVAVIGGRGGAGASTLAAAIARVGLRRGLRTLLLDADPLGGGIDLLLGAETSPGLRWSGLLDARGRVAPDSLRQALPVATDLSFLAWDRGEPVELPALAVGAVLDSAIRGFDLIVADLPRTGGPVAAQVLARATRTVLITTADVRGAASAEQVLATLPACDVGLVVRGPAPGGISGELIAEALELPLVGYLRVEPGLAQAVERGDPPPRPRGPLAQICARVLDELGSVRAA